MALARASAWTPCRDFATFMGSKQAALMRGHGVSVVGSSVEDAVVRTLALNELVTMTYKAYLLGTPQPISEEDQAEMRKPLDPNRPRGTAGGQAGMLAQWRYYCSLANE
jgi:Class II Aldolase and Adducin N-terminal domain